MISRLLIAAMMLALPVAAQAADAKSAKEKAQAEIWKLEQDIYHGRATAGLRSEEHTSELQSH